MNISIIEILSEVVHTASGGSRLIEDTELTALCSEKLPAEMDKENSQVRKILKELDLSEESPVKVLWGRERIRCFDQNLMSLSYAEALHSSAEGDNLETIAETVRKESRMYPRPCMISIFLRTPYNLEASDLDSSIQNLVHDNSKYKDIHSTTASNGDVYLYSSLYINKARADYLAEWESVGSHECQ